MALLGGVAPAGSAESAFRVDRLILTTFDGEQEPFLRHQRWDLTFPPADGQFATVSCRTVDHVCVTMTGTTKSKSGPSTMALLRDPRNADLVSRAYQATRQLTLADDRTADAERAYYGAAEVAETPRVQRCDTAGSDGFWVGADWADKADHIVRERVTAVDPAYRGFRCSSEFEDPAIAGALKRLGLLDRLVVVRAASDFEDERPGTSPRALYDLLHSPAGFAGYEISRENAYRVAWQVAHAL
jgi:purine nucleoside permease